LIQLAKNVAGIDVTEKMRCAGDLQDRLSVQRLCDGSASSRWVSKERRTSARRLREIRGFGISLLTIAWISPPSAEQQLGKPVLSDLKEGKVTMPLIYAMDNGHRDARRNGSRRVLEEKDFISGSPKHSLHVPNPVRSTAPLALAQDTRRRQGLA